VLASEINSARTKLEFFDRLFDDSNLALLDRIAPGFFSTVAEVLFDNLVLTFVRLVDLPEAGGRANLTLGRLVEMLDETRFPEERLQADELNCRLQLAAGGLRRHRNRRIAHNDLQTLKATQVPAATPADLFGQTTLPGVGLSHFRDVLTLADRLMTLLADTQADVDFKVATSSFVVESVPTLLQALRTLTPPLETQPEG
jgi:hypothetical protein